MAGLSIWHVLIFAIVVLLLFGTSKLKNLGKDVGGAVKDFKKSIKDDDTTTALCLFDSHHQQPVLTFVRISQYHRFL